MKKASISIFRLFLSALVIAAIVIAVFLYLTRTEPRSGTSGVSGTVQQTGEALIGGPFILINHLGEEVTEQDFLGSYTLIYFGYSFCPDVCPFELQKMSAALDLFEEERGNLDNIQPVFISVDPTRDTVDVLAAYVPLFHEKLIGLTGTEAQVKAAAQAYKVYYTKNEESEDTYLVDHSSIIYLMGPDGKYITHFTALDTPETIKEGLMTNVR